MTSYERCPKAVEDMAEALLREFPEHRPVLDAKVRIDFVFGYPEYDEAGEPQGFALLKNGIRVFALTRKIALKDRALGRGDAEIALDGQWWDKEAKNDSERRALLDHELHHIAVQQSGLGVVRTDDLSRPLITLRKHDVEIGWFAIVARRHAQHSQECIQAKFVMDNAGQLFWPGLFGEKQQAAHHDGVENAVRNFRSIVEKPGGEITIKSTTTKTP